MVLYGDPLWGSSIGILYWDHLLGSFMSILYEHPQWGSSVAVLYGGPLWKSSMRILLENPLWASSMRDLRWGCSMGIVCWNLLRGTRSSMGILYEDLLKDPLGNPLWES